MHILLFNDNIKTSDMSAINQSLYDNFPNILHHVISLPACSGDEGNFSEGNTKIAGGGI